MADLLQGMRRIAIELNCAPLSELIQEPIYDVIFRVTSYYLDNRAHNSVSTIYSTRDDVFALTAYEALFDNKQLKIAVTKSKFNVFHKLTKRINLENITDDPHLGDERNTVWFLEYATINRNYGILFSPHTHERPYTDITNAIDSYFSRSVRQINKS